MLLLNEYKPIYDISQFPINIFPYVLFTILNKEWRRLVLPDPVRPTIPILSPDLIFKFIFFKMFSGEFSYFIL
jgi:hypothetical protein